MIFSIYGTDQYQISKKLKEVKHGFIQKRDKAGLNVVDLDGEKLNLNQFYQEALTTPFLGDKKMVIIRNSINNKKLGKEIVVFLKENITKIDNIICFIDFIDSEKNRVDKKNKLNLTGDLFKYLSKQEYIWEFNLIKGKELENWIKKYTTNNNIKIKDLAIKELAIKIGNDLFQITNELNKLSAFKAGGEISSDDIKINTTSNFDDNIFALVDTLGNKDRKNALKLITNQLNFGTHPLMIVSMISRQFKLILKTKSESASAGNLKIHPFVFGKIKIQSRNFTTQNLTKIVNEILDLEKQIKSGEKNPELLLNMFIIKNC